MTAPRTQKLLFAAVWHGLVLVAIIVIPPLVKSLPLRLLLTRDLFPLRELFPSAAMAAGYIVAALIVVWLQRSREKISPLTIYMVFLAVQAPIFFYLLLYPPEVVILTPGIVVWTATVMFTGAALYPLVNRWPAVMLPALGAAVFAAVLSDLVWVRDERLAPVISDLTVTTSLYDIGAKVHRHFVPLPVARGGGLARLGDDILLATGDGLMYLVTPRDDQVLDIRELPHRVPVNPAAFIADASSTTETYRFRVSDILVDEVDGGIRLFAAHHYWKADQQCYVLRVSRYDGTVAAITRSNEPLEWKTVFETQPCLKLREVGPPFSGHSAGGRLALIDHDTLLLSAGDHAWDGYYNTPAFAQMDDVDYGKILRINLLNGQKTIYSKGHRNPQGLYVDSAGRVWATEHGMQGGDELNLIHAGGNYGWPYVSYGTDYGSHVWPPSATQGAHTGYVRPMYAWLPAGIGISDLIEVRNGDYFEAWKGDLLVSSLVGSSLFRIRYREGRVVTIERIKLSDRVADHFRMRDVVETKDGRLLLWLDEAALVLIYRSAEPSTGKELFKARCSGCHAIGKGTAHGIGPDLANVMQRDIASAAGYNYSPALRQLEGEWTKRELETYLESPSTFAPGTSMEFAGIPDPLARDAIIAYLTEPE